jgi:hypothetical protein
VTPTADVDRPFYRLRVVPWLRRLGKLLIPNWLAIALGHHILAWRPLSPTELAHELEHVRQWQRHGASFPLRYALESWRAWRRREGWYQGNRFEGEAREAALRAGGEPGRPI